MSTVLTQRARPVAVAPEPSLDPEFTARDSADAASRMVVSLCEGYGLRREELTRLTGFSLRAVADWSAGKAPSVPALRRLREVRRLLEALESVVRREHLLPWLRTPNPAFGGSSPLQVVENGEMDRLWLMVHELGSGEPG